MRGITVEELARWRAGERDFILLDVREPFELQMASLTGALHVPMRDIPERVIELDPAAEIAVLCHYGTRSERVAEFLRSRGFTRAHNVEGGIDAYSERVDRTIPRY
jgi:rhodanese-related sulfurtransferase